MKRIFKWLGFTTAVLSIFVHSTVRAAGNFESVGSNATTVNHEMLAQAPSNDFQFKDFNFWVNQCRLLESEQKYAEALAVCEKAIALRPRSNNRELWSIRSNALLQLKQYPEAVASYDYLLRFSPKDSLAWTRRCEALYQLENYDEALASCEKALQIDGNWGNASPAVAWYDRGLILQKLERKEEALISFERALEINGDYTLALTEKCGLLSDLQRYEDAIATCDIAAEKTPLALNNRAVALAKTGEIEEAIASYERALANNPNDANAWTNQGILLEKLGQDEQALTSYNKALQINPKSSLALVNKCATLNRLGNYKEALTACENAIAGDGVWGDTSPDRAWNQRSHALLGLAEYQEALASVDRAININPNFAEAWNNKSAILWHLQKYEDAQQAVEQALEFKPKYSQAWFNQGRILSTLGKYDEAVKAYNLALLNDVNALENLTCANILDNQIVAPWDAKQYSRIIDAAKNSCSDILANKSVALWHLKQYQDALVATDRAIQFNPKSFEAWYNRGVVSIDLREYQQALDAYERANRISPNNVYVLTGKGLALEGLGDDRQALDAFEAALNINPDYELAQQYRELVLQKLI